MAKKVLVLEDEAIIAQLIKDVLGLVGAEAFLAADPESAENILIKDEMDMAIVDYSLPGGNGISFCQLIEEKYPDLAKRCVLTSGFSPAGDIAAYVKESGIHFIQKPFPVAQLKNLVSEVLQD